MGENSQEYEPYNAKSLMTCRDAERKVLPDQGRAIRTSLTLPLNPTEKG